MLDIGRISFRRSRLQPNSVLFHALVHASAADFLTCDGDCVVASGRRWRRGRQPKTRPKTLDAVQDTHAVRPWPQDAKQNKLVNVCVIVQLIFGPFYFRAKLWKSMARPDKVWGTEEEDGKICILGTFCERLVLRHLDARKACRHRLLRPRSSNLGSKVTSGALSGLRINLKVSKRLM